MSASRELQKLIVDTLLADVAVAAIVGVHVYDEVPTLRPYPCVEIGPSDFVPDDADCIDGRMETVQLDVWHQDNGRLNPCKATVDAVYAALHEADLVLPDPYALASIRVVLAQVMRDPDGITAHGVVQVETRVEGA